MPVPRKSAAPMTRSRPRAPRRRLARRCIQHSLQIQSPIRRVAVPLTLISVDSLLRSPTPQLTQAHLAAALCAVQAIDTSLQLFECVHDRSQRETDEKTSTTAAPVRATAMLAGAHPKMAWK